MITKTFPPSRNTILSFLSLILPASIFFAIRTPAFITLGISRIVIIIVIVVCIFFGGFGLKKFRQSEPTLITRIVSVLGLLLCVVLVYYVWNIKLTTVRGVIYSIGSYPSDHRFGYIHSLVIRPDEPVPDFAISELNPGTPVFITNTTWDTLVLKQTIWQLTSVVDQSELEVNQHIEIEYSGWIIITDPAQINATVIRILD